VRVTTIIGGDLAVRSRIIPKGEEIQAKFLQTKTGLTPMSPLGIVSEGRCNVSVTLPNDVLPALNTCLI